MGFPSFLSHADVGLTEVDLAASGDGAGLGGVLSVLVADDVGGGVGIGGDEAVVSGLLVPASLGRDLARVLLGVVVVEDVALLVCAAIGGETLDDTVGSGLGGEDSAGKGELGGEGRHFDGMGFGGRDFDWFVEVKVDDVRLFQENGCPSFTQ